MSYALITGATSGIGECLLHELAKDGYDLILVGRNKDKLSLLSKLLRNQYGVHTQAFCVDLEKRRALEKFVEALKAQDLRLDCFINNAGIGTYGLFHEGDVEVDDALIEVNIRAFTYLNKALYPLLNKGAQVLQVASTAAFAPGPYMSVYYASKAYVLSLSLALREEWQPAGISVSVLCPGPTKTAFQSRAKMQKKGLAETLAMTPEAVARIAYKGMKRRQAVIVPGVSNQLAVGMMGILPPTLGARLVNATQDKEACQA